MDCWFHFIFYRGYFYPLQASRLSFTKWFQIVCSICLTIQTQFIIYSIRGFRFHLSSLILPGSAREESQWSSILREDNKDQWWLMAMVQRKSFGFVIGIIWRKMFRSWCRHNKQRIMLDSAAWATALGHNNFLSSALTQ